MFKRCKTRYAHGCPELHLGPDGSIREQHAKLVLQGVIVGDRTMLQIQPALESKLNLERVLMDCFDGPNQAAPMICMRVGYRSHVGLAWP